MSKNSILFWAIALLTLAAATTSWILGMLALYKSDYMQINNTSPDPEIYSIFRQITFDLYGHCILINKSLTCRKAGADSIFSRFYDLQNVLPKAGTPQQFVDSLANFTGQNPYVFYPLLIATCFGFLSMVAACTAAIVKTKKSIVWLGGIIVVTFLATAVALGISVKIYDDIIPDLLNNPMTVSVVRNNRTVNLVGTPAQLGIKSRTLDGIPTLSSSLGFVVMALILSVRWWFEGADNGISNPSSRYFV